jgi:hypothetical protein
VTKRMDTLLALIDRVARVAGGTKASSDGGMFALSFHLHRSLNSRVCLFAVIAASHSEDYMDELMDSEDKGAFLNSLSPSDAANLASFMRRKYQDDQANVWREIAEEVQVRAFRLGPVERNGL